jgi:hypothetical protein
MTFFHPVIKAYSKFILSALLTKKVSLWKAWPFRKILRTEHFWEVKQCSGKNQKIPLEENGELYDFQFTVNRTEARTCKDSSPLVHSKLLTNSRQGLIPPNRGSKFDLVQNLSGILPCHVYTSVYYFLKACLLSSLIPTRTFGFAMSYPTGNNSFLITISHLHYYKSLPIGLPALPLPPLLSLYSPLKQILKHESYHVIPMLRTSQ